MKFAVIVLGIVVVVFAMDQEIFRLPQEKILRIQKTSNACAQEHNVDPELFNRISEGALPRDEATNKYLHCFATKIGVVDADGHIFVDKVASYFGDHPRIMELKEALKKCNEVTKDNPIATVVEMNRCMASTAPVHVSW